MTTPTYSWNPFQDITTCDIKGELLTSQGGDRVILIPRAAPFFTKNLVLTNTATGKVLVEGKDYVFIYMFEDFIKSKSALVFGGIVLIGNTGISNYSLDYSTIGGPFVLDDNAYASALANIQNTPRIADWRDVTNLPIDGFPADPHDHPMSQTLNYGDMILSLKSLAAAMNNELNNPTVQTQLALHAKESLAQAHGGGTPADVGLDQVRNDPYAQSSDLKGNSTELSMNLGITKLLFSQMFKAAMGNVDSDDVVGILTGVTESGLDSLQDFASGTTPELTTTPIIINLSDTLAILIGEGSVTLTMQTGANKDTYEGRTTIAFPKKFTHRPAILLQNYDGVNFSKEYCNYLTATESGFTAIGGGDVANQPLTFLWVAIGNLAN